MRLFSLILVPVGIFIELLVVWACLAGWAVPLGLLTLLLGHLLAVAILVAGLYLALPSTYRGAKAGPLAFLATSALFVPLLGPVGLVLGMLPGLYFAYHEQPEAWDSLEIPELPFQPVQVDPNDVFMRDGLSSVLLHFDDRNRRQQAILACRHLPRREAVPILRSGLGDSADEVRLLAYAMINSIERDLENQLNVVRDTIAASGDQDGELHEERAQLFWEFSYLQLARGSVEELMLTKALTAIDMASDRRPTAQRWLLRARICMELDRHDDTQDALERAEQMGLEDDDSAPRWAELAYRRGRFDEVAPALERMSPRAGANPVMRPVLEYWL
ncbi:tetratricopeptide repeat protein [Salinisphaera aquimarina]|uniref:Tetratricopeptide repeat protein n=1 Tax=Salinisphaera aquimarina TaxID=2094031 RepID=A0ABV7ET20_9GAMM